MTHGSRLTDGEDPYQGPATDSAKLDRGRPLKSNEWQIGTTHVTLWIVPLTGGRPELFSVELLADDKVRRHSELIPCMLRGGGLAEAAYARTAELLDGGTIPDRIILPAGARVGW